VPGERDRSLKDYLAEKRIAQRMNAAPSRIENALQALWSELENLETVTRLTSPRVQASVRALIDAAAELQGAADTRGGADAPSLRRPARFEHGGARSTENESLTSQGPDPDAWRYG
jgi:hypothetical protein